MNVYWSPKRFCAVCTVHEVNYPHTICSSCTEQWKTEITNQAPWVQALIEESDREHLYNRQSQGKLISLFDPGEMN